MQQLNFVFHCLLIPLLISYLVITVALLQKLQNFKDNFGNQADQM